MKISLALLFALVCIVPGSSQRRNQASLEEKRELLRLIVKDDKEVGEMLDDIGGYEGALKLTHVRKLDLNRDGQPEYLVELEEGHLCGALGNCPDWVYRKTGEGYELLLRTRGRQLLLEKTSAGGYRDLRSEAGDTAWQGDFAIYQYDGKKYRANRCYLRKYTGKRVKITPTKCQEMTEDRR